MSSKNLNIAITVSESSGDLLGSHLMTAIQTIHPNTNFFGIGGPLMLAQGFKTYFNQEDLAVMGYVEVLKNLSKILSIRKKIISIILEQQPDIYIGIDAPDFNFKIEKAIHQYNIPTIHYVSPSVWAWKAKRVEKIISFTDNILCLFPMESTIYQNKGGQATYVGHPLASTIPLEINQSDSRKRLNLPSNQTIVSIMPGSRESEINYLAPIFLQTAHKLFATYSDIQFFIPVANQQKKTLIQEIIQKEQLQFLPIKFIASDDINKHYYISASDVCLVASGTATLEVALCKCPMLVSYIISPITYHLVKYFVHTNLFGLPNILLQEEVVPEFIQQDVTTENLFQTCQKYLNDPNQNKKLLEKFNCLHQQLQQNTAELAAKAVLETITKHPS